MEAGCSARVIIRIFKENSTFFVKSVIYCLGVGVSIHSVLNHFLLHTFENSCVAHA